MISAYLHGIGLLAPGLESWQQTQSILRGDTPYQPNEVKLVAPTLLPANERRRTTRTIRLALQVAQMATQHRLICVRRTQIILICAQNYCWNGIPASTKLRMQPRTSG